MRIVRPRQPIPIGHAVGPAIAVGRIVIGVTALDDERHQYTTRVFRVQRAGTHRDREPDHDPDADDDPEHQSNAYDGRPCGDADPYGDAAASTFSGFSVWRHE